MKGMYAKKNTEAKKKLKEFRVKSTEEYKEGNEFGLEIFKDIKQTEAYKKVLEAFPDAELIDVQEENQK
jgi:large subunit ribosomal protein L3